MTFVLLMIDFSVSLEIFFAKNISCETKSIILDSEEIGVSNSLRLEILLCPTPSGKIHPSTVPSLSLISLEFPENSPVRKVALGYRCHDCGLQEKNISSYREIYTDFYIFR